MSIISIGIPIPDRSALPGQTGGGEEVNLQYTTQNYCSDHIPNPISPSVATPTGGSYTFSVTSGGPTLGLVPGNGTVNIQTSNPGSYVVTYTVPGVDSANFPINIGAAINTTITGDSSTCIGFSPSPADLTAVSGYSNYEWFKDNTSVQNGTSNTYTPAFNVAGNFVYKVTITDSSLGIPCTATSSNFTFTVNALPTISISGTNFCAGQSTTLTATPSTGTFVWELNTGSGFNVISGQTNNTISVNSDGEYRAKVTDANGCTSAYSNTLSIAEFASPSVTIATVPGTTICTGDTATLTANASGGSGSFTYSWSTGAIIQAISVTASGTYTVTVTDGNGCTATASQAITASTAATTIASINNDAAMSFNGTDNFISASGNDILGDKTVSLWFYSDNIATTPAVSSTLFEIQPVPNSNDYLRIWQFGNRILASSGPVSANGNSSSTLLSNTWYHLVVTKTTTNVTNIYIDGVNDTQAPNATLAFTAGDNGDTIIGRSATAGKFFKGKIDEVAIWDSELSSCDIKGIYEGSIGSNAGKAANLLDANTTIPAPVYWNRMGDS